MALQSESPGFDFWLCSLNSFPPDRIAGRITDVNVCQGAAQSHGVVGAAFPVPSRQLFITSATGEQGGASPSWEPASKEACKLRAT